MEVPGSYGIPLISAIKDKLDFFYFQGEVEFFKSRARKYQSTVYKVNFNPSPPGFPNPAGIALLDQKSFPVLFDNAKVDKRDVFVGPFKPDNSFTGGFRTLAYLDTEDSKHGVLKDYVFAILESSGRRFLPELEISFARAFGAVESEIKSDAGKSALKDKLDTLAFEFMAKSVARGDPTAELGSQGPALLNRWIGVQFAPIAPRTPLPSPIEDLLLRTIPLPSFLAQDAYSKICDFFRRNATAMLDLGERRFKLGREEALHNLVFVVGVNGFLGFSRLLPTIVFYVSSQPAEFQRRLGDEIRRAMRDCGDANAFFAAMERMPLLKSTVLEVMRFAPPVLYQYGRARKDFLVESASGRAFQIRKGDLLGGSQALVCRDPTVFDSPEEFVPDRFLGDRGEELESCVFWSNGRNTDSTSSSNKQCGAKSLVEVIGRFFLAQIFLRYESVELVSPDSTPSAPVIKSLKRAVSTVSA